MRSTVANVNPGNKGSRWWAYPATILLLGVLSLAMLVWTDQLNQRLRIHQFSSDTLRDSRQLTATAHLWLEEGLTDGVEAKLQRALRDVAEALRLSQVLLDGGESEYGYTVPPLVVPALRQRAEELTRLLIQLSAGTHEKIEMQAGPGSPIDMRFNAVFEEFQSRAEAMEKVLEANQAADHAKSRRLFYGMLAAWSSILGVSVLGLVRRERRRRQAEEALQAAKAELELRVAERTVQLRQLNDQLAAELHERKKADLELQKFVSLADNSSELIGMCDMNLGPFYVNEAGIRLLGLSGLEQVRRTPIAEFFFSEDQRFITEDFFPRVLHAGRAEVEIRFRHFQTGAPLWMIYTAFCIKDASGLPVAVAMVSRNITERKQAEEALRTSEERLTAIVASAMDAIITVDEDERVVLFNAAAEEIFHCPASDAIGKPLECFIPERFPHIHASQIEAPGAIGVAARSMGSPARLRGRRNNGEEFPLEATISQASTRGQTLYTVILRDITQREKAEEVAKLYATTREREQLRMEFFANISHELRTPLALILGPVWKILEGGGLADDARRDLEVVERNARLLLRHVNDLLDLAKIDAGRMAPRYAEVDLAELVRVTASNFKSLAAERDIRYVSEAPDSLVAEVDPPQIERVVLNLLSNAFKFTPAGGCVRVTLSSQGDRAILEVEDTGPGVPAPLRETIFERFRQVEGGSTRRFGGTGLGLSITKEFVALHDGSITVGDPPHGVGSVFRVELPLRAPSAKEVRRTAGPPEREPARQVIEELGLRSPTWHPPGQASPGSPVVLVAEDNPDMNAFISRTLAQKYHVISALDGQEGIEKALEFSPDLILCDVMMPQVSGDQMVRELRRFRALDDVPIVLLTAKVDDEELRATLLKEGAQDYLSKPISVEHLMAKVERLLADRRRITRAELERALAAEQLQRTREVSARLLVAHDQERKRIAEELTENIAQCLAGLGISLSLAKKASAPPSAAVQRILGDGLQLLEQSAQSIRSMSYALHPMLLDHFGLRAAFEWHVKDFAERSGIAVTLDISDDLEWLSPEIELALYRIMEEALTNVRRHSTSARATVRVFQDESEVGLEVIDEGHGMPPAVAAGATSLGAGISSMRERARGLGGRLEIESGSDGTCVRAVLPLRYEQQSVALEGPAE
jgi:PAS domain S-box-containing protein